MTKHNDDKDHIVAYLSYLRDVSRRIVSNTGFENCFLSKGNGYALQFDNLPQTIQSPQTWQLKLQQPWAKNSLEELKKTSAKDAQYYPKTAGFYKLLQATVDKKLFAGFGTIGGYGGVTPRIFAAPIIFLECEISSADETLSAITIEPNMGSLSLNYDLISKLVDVNSQDDGIAGFNQNALILENIVSDIEKEILEIQNNFTYQIDELPRFAKRIFEKLESGIEEFKNIHKFDNTFQEYDFEVELGSVVNQKSKTIQGASMFAFNAPLYKKSHSLVLLTLIICL